MSERRAGWLRVRGRRKVMACAYCGSEKGWPDHFVNRNEAKCLVCWLRDNPEKIEPFRRALAALEIEKAGTMTQGDWP